MISELIKAFKLDINLEKIPEIFSVEVLWFLVASAYVLDSGLVWWSVPMSYYGTFREVYFEIFLNVGQLDSTRNFLCAPLNRARILQDWNDLWCTHRNDDFPRIWHNGYSYYAYGHTKHCGGSLNFLCRFSILILVLSNDVILWISVLFSLGKTFTTNKRRGRLYLSMTFCTHSTECLSLDKAEAISVLVVMKCKFLIAILYDQN